ncbi:hypothetical protein OSC52_15310 [Clostridium pasteurianum]|uniref:hypothetical protein n=1 Tax=Clostridium pasteurianum TaxID=1501 RepID=UPI002260B835|nr:hypothetical protein [Clostridium pasteurianum]UZW13204.1 hypothetical protein OSC52_15310 [Clostridium pasteurianum]
MPKVICKYPGCNELINKGEIYCKEHKIKAVESKRQEYKFYDSNRKDSKEWNFYKTPEWEWFRDNMLDMFDHLDLYSYYIDQKIRTANTVHHIVEIKEDWDRRLDENNVFPLTEGNHRKIHNLYKKDKEGTQSLLKDLISKFRRKETS